MTSSASGPKTRKRAKGPNDPVVVSNPTHERILRVAAAAFKERGYYGTTLAQIAESTDVLQGSLYYYIDDKEDLLRQVLLHFGQEIFVEVTKVMNSDDSPSNRIRLGIKQHLRLFLGRTPAFYIVLEDHMPISPALRKYVLERQYNYRSAWIDVIKQGIESGEFYSDVDPEMAYYGIIGMVSWSEKWYKPRGRLTLDEIGDHFANLVLDGLCAPASPGPPRSTVLPVDVR